jgi:hypothetical protein
MVFRADCDDARALSRGYFAKGPAKRRVLRKYEVMKAECISLSVDNVVLTLSFFVCNHQSIISIYFTYIGKKVFNNPTITTMSSRTDGIHITPGTQWSSFFGGR